MIINGKEVYTNQHCPTPEIYEFDEYGQMEWYKETQGGFKQWILHTKDTLYFLIKIFHPRLGNKEILFNKDHPRAKLFGLSWGEAEDIARCYIVDLLKQWYEEDHPKPKPKPQPIQLTLDLF